MTSLRRSMTGAALLCVALLLTSGCPKDSADSGTDGGGPPADSAATDAGPQGDGVAGSVTTTVMCAGTSGDDDCMGTLVIGVFDGPNWMLAALVDSVQIPGVDLSTGGPVPYAIPTAPEGSWFLSGFLDDDANAVFGPDTGDPSMSTSVAVTITAGMQTNQDLVLDGLEP